MLVERLGEMISRARSIIDPVEKRHSFDASTGRSLEVDITKHLRSGIIEINTRDGSAAGVVYMRVKAEVRGGRITRVFEATQDYIDGTALESSEGMSMEEVQGVLEQHNLV